MHAFWHFAARLLKHKARLATAMGLALISAGGLGAGLLALAPVLEFLLRKNQSLGQWINQNASWVPSEFTERLPKDAFGGVVVIFVGLLVMTAVGAVANFGHQYLALTLCVRTITEIRHDIFKHAVNLPLGTVLQRGA
ncbi:MAG: hypothetical protein EXS04_06240, partial [Phycisphaerales bacterium]|nr:hypothetical protein [Phycisphaerales bacterium]